MIKVGIYDSDILILSEMENLLLQLESVRKIFIDIDVFNEKSDFLSHMNDEVYDLIYLSIQDDYKEIIAIAQEAKDYNPHVTIIYLAEDESLWKLLLEEAHMFRLITKPIDHNFFCK